MFEIINKLKSTRILAFLFIFVFIGLFLSANPALAQEGPPESAEQNYQPLEELPGITNDDGVIDVTSSESLPQFANQIAQIMIGLAIALAVVMLIVAGAQYMSTGSFSKKGQAKSRMTQAFGGLILALSAVLILNTINPSLTQTRNIEPVTATGSRFVQPTPPSSEQGWCSYDSINVSGNDYDCYSSYSECQASWTGGECTYKASPGDTYTETIPSNTIAHCAEINRVNNVWYCSSSADSCEQATDQISTHWGEDYVVDPVDPCTRYLNGNENAPSNPDTLDENWNAVEYCPSNNPNGNCTEENESCINSTDAGCYQSPINIYGGESAGCDDCVFLKDRNISTRSGTYCSPSEYGNEFCRIQNGFASSLENFNNAFSGSYLVTEAFPPTRDHANNCHNNGSCVDIGVRPVSIRDTNNTQRVEYLDEFIRTANESMKACYEVTNESEEIAILNKADEMRANGEDIDIGPEDIATVPEASAAHFSVYNDSGEFCSNKDPR